MIGTCAKTTTSTKGLLTRTRGVRTGRPPRGQPGHATMPPSRGKWAWDTLNRPQCPFPWYNIKKHVYLELESTRDGTSKQSIKRIKRLENFAASSSAAEHTIAVSGSRQNTAGALDCIGDNIRLLSRQSCRR